MDATGTRIRARQGHTVAVELDYAPAPPSLVLYQGTGATLVPSIRRQGLLRVARHHVHLSSDFATAGRVGRRRGRAVVILIDTARMAAAGREFFCTGNGVWLTEHVPPEGLLDVVPLG